MSKPDSTKPPSLLERAAKVYDFGAAMRANAPQIDAVSATPPPRPIAVEPLRPVVVEVAPGAREAMATHTAAFRGRTAHVDRDDLREAGFILPDSPVSVLAEEFRIVKRQLLLSATRGDQGGKERMILVCSAQPNDGKTFSAVNLALSMASEKDFEVLLVDADIAKPEVLSTLGLSSGPGLMDAVADPAIDVETCIIRTDIGNLHVLPAGRQTNEDTELLASDRTRAVVDQLASRPNRIVIFDSPPALAASAASVLALHVGQVVMVVRADKTSETELRDAVSLLNGCDDIQLLLNGTAYSGTNRKFGSYYGYGA